MMIFLLIWFGCGIASLLATIIWCVMQADKTRTPVTWEELFMMTLLCCGGCISFVVIVCVLTEPLKDKFFNMIDAWKPEERFKAFLKKPVPFLKWLRL